MRSWCFGSRESYTRVLGAERMLARQEPCSCSWRRLITSFFCEPLSLTPDSPCSPRSLLACANKKIRTRNRPYHQLVSSSRHYKQRGSPRIPAPGSERYIRKDSSFNNQKSFPMGIHSLQPSSPASLGWWMYRRTYAPTPQRSKVKPMYICLLSGTWPNLTERYPSR